MKAFWKCLIVFVICAIIMGTLAAVGHGDFLYQTSGAFVGLIGFVISAFVGATICALIAEKLKGSSGTVAIAFGIGALFIGPLLFPGPLIFYFINHALKH